MEISIYSSNQINSVFINRAEPIPENEIYFSKFILQFSMSNLSATSIASAVLITVALIASILSLAIDRWGQFSITVGSVAKTDVRTIVVSHYTLFTRFLCISKTARVSSAPDTLFECYN